MKNTYHADIKSGVLCGPSYPRSETIPRYKKDAGKHRL
jgi:hypothetical protein